MITGEIKNRIDTLWNIFAASGLTNPLEVVEQITYLMFIKDLDDTDNLRARESEMLGLEYTPIFPKEVIIRDNLIEGNQLKWSVFKDYPAEKTYRIMIDYVFPFIKNLHGNKDSAYSKYMDDAIFKIPTPLVLSKIIDSLNDIFNLMKSEKANNQDVKGDVYEYLLDKIASAGRNGQFRTPTQIIKMMVELLGPKPTDSIADPACGSRVIIMTRANSNDEYGFQALY